ncbi:ATP-dependent RNA helicase dbp4 [Actinomortierella ambigua]|nr:ATP-dependent RNA helicase dbp4 [Actinomortierella ambigua]
MLENILISPTRVQIFEVLCKIGLEHSFSVGLVIGGKDWKIERELITWMNILVWTPGRLLQHMGQSAGQKSVKDLARLNLKDPEYVTVHEKAEHATPQGLSQYYMTVPLGQKLDVMFNIIKTHLTAKGTAFLSNCKQIRFVIETFGKLHPGVSLMHSLGKQKQ